MNQDNIPKNCFLQNDIKITFYSDKIDGIGKIIFFVEHRKSVLLDKSRLLSHKNASSAVLRTYNFQLSL